MRCIEQRCVVSARSRLGDFHAAVGRRATSAGDTNSAVLAYNDAVTTYEKEGIAPPSELLCEQGIALAQGLDDPKIAEAASRILHKCVLAIPGTSSIARAAMDALAALTEAGLDGNLLARTTPADLYLTGQARGPNMDKLAVVVIGDAKNTKRSFGEFMEVVGRSENEVALRQCWQESWKKHKQETLGVALVISYRFVLDEDDESRDRAVIKVELDGAVSGSGQAGPAQCVLSVVTAAAVVAAKKTKQDTRWKSKIRIRVGEQ